MRMNVGPKWPRRWVGLSPHVDDVALSLGALTAFRPDSLYGVVNVFSHSGDYTSGVGPWARNTHVRIAEDQAFFERVAPRAVRLYLGLRDAPLRLGIGLEQVFDAPESQFETEAVGKLVAAVMSRILPRTAIACPLAIGNHVDHRIVAQVGCELARAGAPVFFFEDVPYAASTCRETVQELVEATERRSSNRLLMAYVGRPRSLQRKLEALAAYRTQFDISVESATRSCGDACLLASRVGVERVYCTAAALAC